MTQTNYNILLLQSLIIPKTTYDKTIIPSKQINLDLDATPYLVPDPQIFATYKPLRNDPKNEKTELFIDEKNAIEALLCPDTLVTSGETIDFSDIHAAIPISEYTISRTTAGYIAGEFYFILQDALRSAKDLIQKTKTKSSTDSSLDETIDRLIHKRPLHDSHNTSIYESALRTIAEEFYHDDIPDKKTLDHLLPNPEFYQALQRSANKRLAEIKQQISRYRNQPDLASQLYTRRDHLENLITTLQFAETLASSHYAPIGKIQISLASPGTYDRIPSCINPSCDINEKNSFGKQKDSSLQRKLDLRRKRDSWSHNQPVIAIEAYRSFGGNYIGSLGQALCFEGETTDKKGTTEDIFVIDAAVAHDSLYLIQGFDWKRELLKGICDYAESQGHSTLLLNTQVGTSHFSLRDFTLYALSAIDQADANLSGEYDIRSKLKGYIGSSKRFAYDIRSKDMPEYHVRKKATDPELAAQLDISDKMFAEGFYDGTKGSNTASSGTIHGIKVNIQKLRAYLQ